jgi:hypothetical protein
MIAFMAFAQAAVLSPARAAECYAVVAGPSHAAIRVETSAQLATPRIGWRPPSKSGAIDLWVAYRSSSLDEVQAPTGGYVQIVPTTPAHPADMFEVITRDGKTTRLAAQPAIYGHFTFIATPTAGFRTSVGDEVGIIRAINAGETIIVKAIATKDGAETIVAEATYDLSATKSRRGLLQQAKAKIDKRDPIACPAPSTRPLLIPPVNLVR